MKGSINKSHFIRLTWRFGKENRKWYEIFSLLAPILAGILFYLAKQELQENDQYLYEQIAVILGILILFFAFVKIKYNKVSASIFKLLVCITIPLLATYLTEFCFGNVFGDLKKNIIIMNYACYAVVLVVFWAITGRVKGGCIGTILFFCVFAILNRFIMKFRGTPIVPWDIYSWKTAASVSENYVYSVSVEMLITALVSILGIQFVFQFPKVKIGWIRYSIVLIAVSVGLIYGYTSIIEKGKLEKLGVKRNLWSQEAAIQNNGVFLNFVNNTKDFRVSKLNGYNRLEEEEIFAKYEQPVLTETQKKNRPTIIAIMNESFCDVMEHAEKGTMKVNQNPLPFTSQWKENLIRGNMLVSVYGGGTATTEFEFLTGQSQNLYPTGSVVYQQFIHEETPSLASVLKQFGYQTKVLHPFQADGWNRPKVYSMFGFDEFLSIDDLKYYEKMRYFCSDKADYDNVIDLYENRGEDPLFVFNITMQNHGGYVGNTNNFTHTIKEKKIKEDSLDEYLSLLYESDQALKYLVEYFEKQEDPVVLCFFGDHWPGLKKKIYDQMFDGIGGFERTVKQRTVPFYIWTNYDIKEREIEWTSPNFLSGLLLETANLPLDPWNQYLKEIQQELCAVSTTGYVDKKGEIHQAKEENEWVLKLKKAQYYYFRDRKK